MDHKKLVVLVATAALAFPAAARAPRPETFADLQNMIINDAYMSQGRVNKNTTKEQRDAQRLVRKANNRAVLDIFTHSLPPAKKRVRAEMIFPSELLQDANFFSTTKENTVFNHVDCTTTHAGQVVFAATLAEGTTDLTVLTQRANMIREFVAHEDMRKNVRKILQGFSLVEGDLLTRWSSSDAAELNKTIEEGSAVSSSPRIDRALSKAGNFLLELTKYASAGAVVGSMGTLGYLAYQNYVPGAVGNAQKAPIALGAAAIVTIASLAGSKLLWNKLNDSIHKNIEHSNLIKKSVVGFNALVETIDKIESELLEHAKKECLPESFKTITELKDRIAELNKKLTDLIGSNDLFAAAQTLTNNVDRISTMLSFVGEIDAYLSMARHHRSLRKMRNTDSELMLCDFCTFNTTSTTPYIRAEGYWNAIINPKIAKTNSIELGGTTASRDAIITGPNAGGKSIALRGLINQLILSHSYHMAWARKFETTPFKLVIGQLNNVDDPTEGKSRLMAEVFSMRNIIQQINKLSAAKGEFAFVVTDELFTGTEVDVAIDISLEMGQVFAELTNVMYILATHYKQLTDLEKITNGVFKNYHVEAYVTEDDRGNDVVYPFKLFPGKGKINVALDIMLLQMKNHEMANDVFYAKLRALQSRQKVSANGNG